MLLMQSHLHQLLGGHSHAQLVVLRARQKLLSLAQIEANDIIECEDASPESRARHQRERREREEDLLSSISHKTLVISAFVTAAVSVIPLWWPP
jgi:hypothetical protein